MVSFIRFFGRISLTELNHRKTELFHVMRHLHSPQIVKSNFFDVKFPPQFINEIFDKAIMSNITIKSFQIILLFSDILQVFLHQRLSSTYPIRCTSYHQYKYSSGTTVHLTPKTKRNTPKNSENGRKDSVI